jgi:hypothetical protein
MGQFSHIVAALFVSVVILFVCLAAHAPHDPVQRRKRREPLIPPDGGADDQ